MLRAYRDGQEQIRAKDVPKVTIGCPHEAMEAWVLCGFKPVGSDEEGKLTQARKRLGFDPTERPDQLSHKNPHPRSAKQVVSDLGLREGRFREEQSLHGALQARSGIRLAVGLEEFIDEVNERIVRLGSGKVPRER